MLEFATSFFSDAVAYINRNPYFFIIIAYVVYKVVSSVTQPAPKEFEGSKVKAVETREQWNSYIEQSRAGKVLIVDFYATWCPPCKKAGPIFGKMSTEYDEDAVTFLKVDVDKNPETSKINQITGMPTFIAISDGAQFDKVVGWSESSVRSMVDKAVAAAKKARPSTFRSEENDVNLSHRK